MCYNLFETLVNLDATPINPDSLVNNYVKQRILHCSYMDVSQSRDRKQYAVYVFEY